MFEIVTQTLNGVSHGKTYISAANRIDDGNSAVQGFSLFVHLNAEGEAIAKPKDTDDKIVIGYTKEGAAFQLVIDGFYGGERERIFAFIDAYVIPLISRYSSNLSIQDDAEKVTRSLIHTIYALRARHAISAEFTMSLGVTYYKSNGVFYAGFGIGDTGMLIKRTSGEVDQLVSHTEVDGFKDAFDSYSETNIDLVIDRNSVFNTKVNPGDELVGYTYIQPELELLATEFETLPIGKKATVKQLVRKMHIDTSTYSPSLSLFDQLLIAIDGQQKQLITKALIWAKEQRFGDDFAIGRLIIPDENLVKQLQIHAFSLAMQDKLTLFITQEHSKQGPFGVLGFFNGANSNIERAKAYKQLLAHYQHQTVSKLFIILMILATDIFKELNQSIVEIFNCSSQVVLQNKLEQLMLEHYEPELNAEQLHELILAMKKSIVELNLTDLERMLNNSLIQNVLEYR